MKKTTLPREMRWLVVPDHRLNIFKYSGDLDGTAIGIRLRSFFSTHPQTISHSSLNDLRDFTGTVTYKDMVGMAKMMLTFRSPGLSRKSILLTRDHAAIYFARLAQDIFQTSIEVRSEVEDAYAAATGGASMSTLARRFMDGD